MIDVHPHIGDLIQIVLAVVDKQRIFHAQIIRSEPNGLIACISPAIVKNDVLRILMEIDRLNVIVFSGVIDRIRIAVLGVVGGGEGVGLLRGEIIAMAIRTTAQHGTLHGCIIPREAAERACLIVSDGRVKIYLDGLTPFQQNIYFIIIFQIVLGHSIPVHGDRPLRVIGSSDRFHGANVFSSIIRDEQAIVGNVVIRLHSGDVHSKSGSDIKLVIVVHAAAGWKQTEGRRESLINFAVAGQRGPAGV